MPSRSLKAVGHNGRPHRGHANVGFSTGHLGSRARASGASPGVDDHSPNGGWTNVDAGHSPYRCLAGDTVPLEHHCRATVGFGPARSDVVADP